MNHAQTNHLRRLLGWVRCEIGPSPEENISTVRNIANKLSAPISSDGQRRLVEAHQKIASVPKYVRDAVKALEKVVGTENIGEAEPVQRKIKS